MDKFEISKRNPKEPKTKEVRTIEKGRLASHGCPEGMCLGETRARVIMTTGVKGGDVLELREG